MPDINKSLKYLQLKNARRPKHCQHEEEHQTPTEVEEKNPHAQFTKCNKDK